MNNTQKMMSPWWLNITQPPNTQPSRELSYTEPEAVSVAFTINAWLNHMAPVGGYPPGECSRLAIAVGCGMELQALAGVAMVAA